MMATELPPVNPTKATSRRPDPVAAVQVAATDGLFSTEPLTFCIRATCAEADAALNHAGAARRTAIDRRIWKVGRMCG